MANTTISPNMGMPVPTVGVDPGPDWATNYDACLSVVDSHNHTAGQGVPITPNAMNINADLPFNGNNATSLRSARFTNQSANLSLAADVGCVYEYAGDLWYNNAGGAQVQLTNGTNPAGGAGSIGGLPSGTASVNFSGGTYTFQSATSTPATLNVGPLVIGQPTNTSKNVTLSPNVAQASNYNLTLPLTLPGVQSYTVSDSSGNLSFQYTGYNVRASEGTGTTTLTSADNFWQVFNLSAARTVLLPSAGVTAGQRYVMQNQSSSGTLTVQSSGENTVCLVDSLYSKAELIALVNSPSTAANWMIGSFTYSQVAYLMGTNYNGGASPTVTGVTATWTNSRSEFLPYQTPDGTWRLRFNISGSFSSSSSTSIVRVTVNGVVFKTGPSQTISVSFLNGTPSTLQWVGGRVDAGTSNVRGDLFAASTYDGSGGGFSGDVELDSKPTWAY